MDVHLVDGTYELFRQFFGQKGRSHRAADGRDVAAVTGVVQSLLSMIEEGATHLAVATDHQIESFRNELWPTYKTSAGVDSVLLSQFDVLEASISALGVTLLAMDELEADDGLASAAAVAAADDSVDRVLIWTPDKDLAQCVRDERVVQVDRRANAILGANEIEAKFGVVPESIPDWLALVGDSADGFPGLAGWGRKSASTVLSCYRHLEEIPHDASRWPDELRAKVRSSATLAEHLRADWDLAVLFRELATLRVEPDLVESAASLRWRGPLPSFGETAAYLSSPRLSERAEALAGGRGA